MAMVILFQYTFHGFSEYDVTHICAGPAGSKMLTGFEYFHNIGDTGLSYALLITVHDNLVARSRLWC